MVTVINAKLRQNEKGSYVTLELQGDIEMVQSNTTGRFYATARRCHVYATFDLETAKSLKGQKMPGTIVKQATEPYDFTIKETGEVIKLAHSYAYVPHDGATPQSVSVPQNEEMATAQ